MPFVQSNNHRMFYRLEGSAGAPVLALSHSIGADMEMWLPQIEALFPYFQVLRYDIRGHGASEATYGDYSIEQLGRDVICLTEALDIKKFAFCGISLGGAIAQWLALKVPERVSKIIVASSSPQFGPPANWEARKKAVIEGGMPAIIDVAMQRFFSSETLARNVVHAEAIRNVLLGTNPAGYAGCCAALRDFDSREQLREIKIPTLVIVGDDDVSTPWEGHGEVLASKIPDSQTVRLSAAHLSNIERPQTFTGALLEFLLPQENSGDPLHLGFSMRRQILGDEYVNRALFGTTDFTNDFQELITRYAWGTVWARPGLDHRTRRLITLAVAAALGRWEEFTLHVRAGLAHDLELCDVEEVLLQTAIYAGVPAANTGFHIASEEAKKYRKVLPESTFDNSVS